jgi:outer membrane protein
MKKFLLLTAAAALVFPIAVNAQGTLKVGTIDMNRAFKEYNRTKDSEKKINEAKDAAKKEFDDRAESYKKALEEINKLAQQLDSPALNADKKTALAKERDEKIASIKNMEREINEFRQTRERQLQEQAMRMRENIVKEITDVIMERVKSTGYDLVFDKSGPSMNGVNVVIHSKDNMDFTTDVITALNKKPVTTTTEKPATSPASTTTTTTSTAAPATSPKKP